MKKIIAALLLSSCSQMATANGREYNTIVTMLLGFEDITDEKLTDISPLTKLDKLTHLNLSGNPIANVSPLAEIESLKYLLILDTSVSEEDIEQLQTRLRSEC